MLCYQQCWRKTRWTGFWGHTVAVASSRSPRGWGSSLVAPLVATAGRCCSLHSGKPAGHTCSVGVECWPLTRVRMPQAEKPGPNRAHGRRAPFTASRAVHLPPRKLAWSPLRVIVAPVVFTLSARVIGPDLFPPPPPPADSRARGKF